MQLRTGKTHGVKTKTVHNKERTFYRCYNDHTGSSWRGYCVGRIKSPSTLHNNNASTTLTTTSLINPHWLHVSLSLWRNKRCDLNSIMRERERQRNPVGRAYKNPLNSDDQGYAIAITCHGNFMRILVTLYQSATFFHHSSSHCYLLC